MPIDDAIRWNSRYQQRRRDSFERPRSLLVDHAQYLPKTGLVLDSAMGLGGNASYLIARGLRVVGIDISNYALLEAKKKLPSLMAVQADLTNYYIPPGIFDGIINFYYLRRELLPIFLNALRPGGVLFFETLTQAMHTIRPDIPAQYLLASGELRVAILAACTSINVEILWYWEGWQASDRPHSRAVASLIARRRID
jgi:tellurite methyltransferase